MTPEDKKLLDDIFGDDEQYEVGYLDYWDFGQDAANEEVSVLLGRNTVVDPVVEQDVSVNLVAWLYTALEATCVMLGAWISGY